MKSCLCGCGALVLLFREFMNAKSVSLLFVREFAMRAKALLESPEDAALLYDLETLDGLVHNCQNFAVLLHDYSIGELTVEQVNLALHPFDPEFRIEGRGNMPVDLNMTPIFEGQSTLIFCSIETFYRGVFEGKLTQQDLDDAIEKVSSKMGELSGLLSAGFNLDVKNAVAASRSYRSSDGES